MFWFSHINYAECIGDKFAISPPIIVKVGRSRSERVCFCFECEWMFHVLDEDNPMPGLSSIFTEKGSRRETESASELEFLG